MISKEDNTLLTSIEGDAPMGRMLRDWYWVPAVRAARVKAGAPPLRVRLFGRNLVVFRSDDGRLGCLDEACPHRGVSLALARNEDNALRCIFHGWKISVTGKLLEVPNEYTHPEKFKERVKINAWPVQEAGGLVWVYLGTRSPAPRLSDLEFTRLKPENMVLGSCTIDCNWVQGLDAALDASHVGLLHQSYATRFAGTLPLALGSPPYYEIDRTEYGFKAAALRDLPDGKKFLRVTTYVMPWFGITATRTATDPNHTCILSVPIDDTHTRQWYLRYSSDGEQCDRGFAIGMLDYDEDNFAPIRGTPEQYWGQNHEAMKNGHFSGFTGNHFVEDTTVQVSMGPIVDRSKEFLTSSDLAVVHLRRTLLAAVRGYLEGKPPPATDPELRLAEITSKSDVLEPSVSWREVA
jgi:phthalate 4,5-dioxygenase oxygenase subunit